MRLKDLEQAILLEQKVALQIKYLQERGGHGLYEESSAESFLPSFGSYKDLVTENCDTTELSRRVLDAVQEISHIASSLYKSANGQDLPIRSFSSVGERHSDLFQSPKLPTRAETFGGFDEKKNKVSFYMQYQHIKNPQYYCFCFNVSAHSPIARRNHFDYKQHNKYAHERQPYAARRRWRAFFWREFHDKQNDAQSRAGADRVPQSKHSAVYHQPTDDDDFEFAELDAAGQF